MKFSYLSGALGTPVSYSLEPYKSKTKMIIISFACCVMAFGFVFLQILSSYRSIAEASETTLATPSQIAQSTQIPKKVEVSQKTIPEFDNVKISMALKNWIIGNKGKYGVVVSDGKGTVIAQYSPDDQFFMASIYKLYVAYLAYQKIDLGLLSPSEPYLNGMTRGQCLDEMIRSSNNPCGEKMMAELGKELKSKLLEYGFSGTSISGFTTSAADTNRLLVRIKNSNDLSESSKAKLLDSMLNQKFREGLPAGFEKSKVFDKVGFRGKQEYHDVGIVELADGRTLMVSIMSDGAGVGKVADLSRAVAESTN